MIDSTLIVHVLLDDYERYSIFQRNIYQIHEGYDTVTCSYSYTVSKYRTKKRWYFFGDHVCQDLEEFVVYYSYEDLITRLPWRNGFRPLYSYLTDEGLIPNLIDRHSVFRR